MNNEPKAGKGIDPEMLAAYIDNRLPPEQRAAVEAQLAGDPDSYALLVDTMQALEDEEIKALEVKEPSTPVIPFARKEKPSPIRTWVIASGVLATAAALALVVWTQPQMLNRLRGGAPVDPLMAKLVDAVGEERYIEARLTGGFRYGPLKPATRNGGRFSEQNLSLLAAAGQLQTLVANSPTVQDRHAWGVAQVLVGDFDGAISTFEDAAAIESRAEILSDLSAALLSRAQRDDRPDDIPKALAFAERALSIGGNRPEALHNKALALEALSLRDQALEAWRELASENEPGWAEVAADHISRLQKRNSAIDQWNIWLAEDVGSRTDREFNGLESEARNWLRIEAPFFDDNGGAIRIGEAMSVATRLAVSDTFDLDWLRTIERNRADVENERRLGRDFGVLLRAAGSLAIAQHGGVIAAHRSSLVDTGHPLSMWFEYFHADQLRAVGRRTEAMQAIDRVVDAAAKQHYTTLVARCHWLRGTLLAFQGRHRDSLEEFESAYQQFSLAEDQIGRGRLLSQISSIQHLLGLETEAWRSRQLALRIASFHRDATLIDVVCTSAAMFALEREYPEAAVAFLSSQQSGDFALDPNDIAGRVQMTLRLAEASAHAGEFGFAAGHVADAATWIPKIVDAKVKQNAVSLRTQVIAEMSFLDARYVEARAAASAGLARGMANRLQEASMRLIAIASASDTTDAENDLRELGRALDDIDTYYRGSATFGLRPLDHRLAFDAAGRSVRYLLSRGDIDEAALLSDRVIRQTGLWKFHIHERSVSQLREALDPGIAVVQYFSSSSGTIAWIHTRKSTTVIELPHGLSAIAQIAQLRQAAERHDQAAFLHLTVDLYRAFIEPLEERFSDAHHLTFVAPGVLQGIPFSALRKTLKSPPLVSAYEVDSTPTIARLSRRDTNRQVADRALVVASDGGVGGWAKLPGVNAELLAIQRIDPNASLLVADQANPKRVLELLELRPRLLHYAGHTSVDLARPEYSSLILRGNGAGAVDSLSIAQLLESQVAAPPIVLLSACSTGRQLGRNAETSASFSSAFLSMGSQGVVAALWKLDDSIAPSAFSAIHGLVSRGMTVSSAVRQVQNDIAFRDHADVVFGIVPFVSFQENSE